MQVDGVIKQRMSAGIRRSGCPYEENGKSEKREAEAETGTETKATARSKKAKAEAKGKSGKGAGPGGSFVIQGRLRLCFGRR
jgi:hypothetical protein